MLKITMPRRLGGGLCGLVVAVASAGLAWGAEAPDGKVVFQRKCALCHASTPIEGFGKSGPNLLGVVGRPAASVADFAYTPALKASGLVWTPQTLDVFLADPPKMVKGTVMPVALPDAQERAAVIRYLQTLKP